MEITTMNNSIGMDEETLERILERRSGIRQGTGLSNVDRSLKQMYVQGLQIRSHPDQGTTVAFVVSK
ncbi:hypothetical protein GK047_08085 [Paenibacillus sp. SYP-B3998]|uniref:Histidine kinase/HSP90-like ATPase domain-containing protein n=1 Tax=Paenibacillus sp. SYP-B3998 TaxID=2678564 RepID=A0A6G3ZV24_9BACL|nr:hypothetical protein [Paenibacillus sp. SYP-B3998]